MGEDKGFRVVVVMDDKSLMVIDGKVETLVHEINNLRVKVLQLLCFENLSKEDKGDVDWSRDRRKSFRNKKWFQFNGKLWWWNICTCII